jgi:hypothetical protein
MKGLGHLWRPPDFAIESIAFIGKSVSELPLAVLTLHAWGGGSKSPNRTIIKTRPKSRVFIMVRLCDLSWNQIELSLILIYEKLVDLGFENYNGKVEINEIETEWSSYHA